MSRLSGRINTDWHLNAGKKLEPEPVPEKEVNELLFQVNEARRIAGMHLRDIKFGEKSKINKEKKRLLAEGGPIEKKKKHRKAAAGQ